MKLGIMQPYIFPYIGYYQLMYVCDKIVFLDNVNYIKKGFIHRNKILTNGLSRMFVLAIKNSSQNVYINNTYFHNFIKCRDKFLKQIKHSYSRSKYFNDVYELINCTLDDSYTDSPISELCITSISNVFKYLNVDFKYIKSSNFTDIKSKGVDRIIEICQSMNATTYINSIGGINIYDKSNFKKNNIDLLFIKTNNLTYNQNNISRSFIPNLSIIDILMHNSKNDIKTFLTNYTLL